MRPDTNAPVEVAAEETARNLSAVLRAQTEAGPTRRKRPTLTEAARPYALPAGVVLTLVAMVAAAVVAWSTKADRADVQRLDDRLRDVEQALSEQTGVLKTIAERLPAAPPALTRTGE